jgi:hypothetical protein
LFGRARAFFVHSAGGTRHTQSKKKKREKRDPKILELNFFLFDGRSSSSSNAARTREKPKRNTNFTLFARTNTHKEGTMMTMTRTATATATTATNVFNTAHKKRFSSSSLSPNKVQNNRRCLRHPKRAATVVVAGRFPDERTYIMIK